MALVTGSEIAAWAGLRARASPDDGDVSGARNESCGVWLPSL